MNVLVLTDQLKLTPREISVRGNHYEDTMTKRTHPIRRNKNWFAGLAALAIALLSLTPVEVHADNRRRIVLPFKDARIKFEVNATDSDGGIQIFADADGWKELSVFDPRGKLVLKTTTRGQIAKQGGTELFLESAEPDFEELPLEELLKRFPAGLYFFSAKGLNRELLVGSAVLTHNIPAGPKLLAPIEGSGLQDPNNTVVRWEPVGPANGSPIIGYQVLVVQPATGNAALPKVVLDVTMPATATSMNVPVGFLKPNTDYEWEVLAIEASGNQTLSSSFLTTGQ